MQNLPITDFTVQTVSGSIFQRHIEGEKTEEEEIQPTELDENVMATVKAFQEDGFTLLPPMNFYSIGDLGVCTMTFGKIVIPKIGTLETPR